jgi:hypothetical protein
MGQLWAFQIVIDEHNHIWLGANAEKFTLAEQEEGTPNEQLTHLGAPLSAIDDFKDALPSDEDDPEDGTLDASFVKDFHFGGGDENGSADRGHRSKSDVMAEVIMKSKAAKLEKRQQKESDQELQERLDRQFSALQKARSFMSSLRGPECLCIYGNTRCNLKITCKWLLCLS